MPDARGICDPTADSERGTVKKLIIAAAYAFDPEGFDGGEEFTPAFPLRNDSFVAQQPAGIRWLHVHPHYVVTDLSWFVVRLARNLEDGFLPEEGVPVQAVWTMAAIDIVRRAWGKMRAERDKRG